MAIMRVLQDRLSSFTYELSDAKNFEEKELHSYKDLVERVFFHYGSLYNWPK